MLFKENLIMSEKSTSERSEDSQLKGLGGWLILVGIHLVLGPVFILAGLRREILPFFSDGAWDAFTTPGTEFYTPYAGPLIVGETVFSLGALLFSLYLLILFFKKHYFFPKAYIAFRIIFPLVVLLDSWLCSETFGIPMMNPEEAREFMRIVIPSVIWILYMLKSKRVKLTFVHGEKGSGGDLF